MNDDMIEFLEVALLAADTVAKREEVISMVRQWRVEGKTINEITAILREKADQSVGNLESAAGEAG